MMVVQKKLGVIESRYRIMEFQFKDISIITTGKHATTFLETHCDNCIDHTYTENDLSNSLNLFLFRDDREYIFLVREPLQRFLSGLATQFKVHVRDTLKIFNVPTTHQNILKAINETFFYNLILDYSIKFDAYDCGNWLKFVSFIKDSKPVPKLIFVKYDDRKNLFLKLGLQDKPIINETRNRYKILYEELSSESKGIIDTYLKDEIKYYNYIFKEI